MNFKNSNQEFSVVILAGGNSKRMKYPKPWLKMKNDVPFLTTSIAIFNNFGIKEIVVVINKKFTTDKWEDEVLKVKKEAIIIKNSTPEKGRLYSLQLGLNSVKNDTIFIHNVDNPFVEEQILEQLATNLIEKGITIPSYNEKGGHPVIITKTVKNEIINNYQQYKTLKEVFFNFPKKYIKVNSNSILKNINTPQEFEKMNA